MLAQAGGKRHGVHAVQTACTVLFVDSRLQAANHFMYCAICMCMLKENVLHALQPVSCVLHVHDQLCACLVSWTMQSSLNILLGVYMCGVDGSCVLILHAGSVGMYDSHGGSGGV